MIREIQCVQISGQFSSIGPIFPAFILHTEDSMFPCPHPPHKQLRACSSEPILHTYRVAHVPFRVLPPPSSTQEGACPPAPSSTQWRKSLCSHPTHREGMFPCPHPHPSSLTINEIRSAAPQLHAKLHWALLTSSSVTTSTPPHFVYQTVRSKRDPV